MKIHFYRSTWVIQIM